MPVTGVNGVGHTMKSMLPDMTKRSTQIKVAVLAATIILTGIVLAVAFDNLGKDLSGPVHKSFWKWGKKKIKVGKAFVGFCALLGGLGLANGYVFGKKIPFDKQLKEFKNLGIDNQRGLSSVTTKAEFIDALKSLDKATMETLYLKRIDESAESDKMSTIRSLVKRCGSGEFKDKPITSIEKIVAKERKREELLYTAAKVVLFISAVLALTMIGLSFSSLGYVKAGDYMSWRLNLGVFITGGVAAAVTGLTIGYLRARKEMNYGSVNSLASTGMQ